MYAEFSVRGNLLAKKMSVRCKRRASFKSDIIMVGYELLIFYLNILVYKLKQLSRRLWLLLVICNENLSKTMKTYRLQCLFKNHNKHKQFKTYYYAVMVKGRFK